MLGLSLLGAAPDFDRTQGAEQIDDSTASLLQQRRVSAGEEYQRAFRQRQIARQIGESAGTVLERQYSYDPEPSELDLIQQEYAQEQTNLLVANQLGQDQRAAAAKRATMTALREAGLEEGLQQIQKEAQKEISAFAVSFGAGAGEIIDAGFEDFGLTEYVTFAQNQAQAARTILSPAPAPVEEAQDLQELVQNVKQQATEAFLDTLIPRMNLHTLSGLTSLGKAILQWFVVGIIMVIISLFIFVQIGIWYTVYSFIENPLSTIMGFVRYQIGI